MLPSVGFSGPPPEPGVPGRDMVAGVGPAWGACMAARLMPAGEQRVHQREAVLPRRDIAQAFTDPRRLPAPQVLEGQDGVVEVGTGETARTARAITGDRRTCTHSTSSPHAQTAPGEPMEGNICPIRRCVLATTVGS